MTTLTPPPSPSRSASRGRRSSKGLLTVGAVLTALGLVAGAVAAAAMIAFGSGNSLDSGPQPFATSTAALVTDSAMMDGVRGIAAVTGRPTVRVSSESGNAAACSSGWGRPTPWTPISPASPATTSPT